MRHVLLAASVAVGLGVGVVTGWLLFTGQPASEPTQWSIHLARAWPFAVGATTGWLGLELIALFRAPSSGRLRPLLHSSGRLFLTASVAGLALGLATCGHG